MKKTFMILLAATILMGCNTSKKKEMNFDEYPVRTDNLLEMEYSPQQTQFALWAPTADEVRVLVYEAGEGGHPLKTINLKAADDGTWRGTANEDLNGLFYTFNVKYKGNWLGDTPGINAHAVGINGQRAAIIDLRTTDPVGWKTDRAPMLAGIQDAVVYEMHHRDFSIHPTSGITHKGQYLALTEEGTISPEGLSTGIDHLKELGITHVHLLPSYDYASVDEKNLSEGKYNWGYDPLNYNVPDGSYSTDPYDPATRIREFKQMVQSLHRAGIRVVLDVVFNHTFSLDGSNFERTVPGYFYRQTEEGTYADASACGNETASNRPMMRRFMVESVRYWMQEYHIDGFRFDLMGIHDIATMNAIRQAATAIDPQVLIYGEGWAASAPAYDADSLAMKANIAQMPGIAAFSDEMRDALRGPWNDNATGAFLAGEPGMEESIKFGLVGAIKHPDIAYDSVNYSKEPWALQPTQMISYVSCHDDMCLVDRLKASIPNISNETLARLDKLAQTTVFVSQGIPFIYAGEEVMRDKQGVHNSYNSPDEVNAIDWHRLATNYDVYQYYRNLISLRRHHVAFRMGNADAVRSNLRFLPVEQSGVIAFQISEARDDWKQIVVVLNARRDFANVSVPGGRYMVICRDGIINEEGLGYAYGPAVMVPPMSAQIMYLSELEENGSTTHSATD